MLTKIKRQDCLTRYPKFPTADHQNDVYFQPEVVSSHLLTLQANSLNRHISQLAGELTRLIKGLGYRSLIFLGDSNLPWRYQDNEYKPAKAALDYLAENAIGKRFNGGLQVETGDLPVFLRHLTWLVRCSASLPLIHFMDPEQQILGSVCQYANLHLHALNPESDQQLTNILQKTTLSPLDGDRCYERYSQTGIIEERQIKM